MQALKEPQITQGLWLRLRVLAKENWSCSEMQNYLTQLYNNRVTPATDSLT